MSIIISGYEAICNAGLDIAQIYQKAINGDNSCFEIDTKTIKNTAIRIGKINTNLPEIKNIDFNIRCNKLILKNLELLKDKLENLFTKYSKNEIGVIVATTNTGVEEYSYTMNKKHSDLSNPAFFVKEYFGLTSGCYITVSCACSSGIKAFLLARDFLNKDFLKAFLVIGVDSIAKLPLFGFNSLEILSDKPSNPFSKNTTGINIAEASGCFIVEKDENIENGIEILSISENTDINHFTTPNPNADEVKDAIFSAVKMAGIEFSDIDYINLHGTGTLANDIMESRAINDIFKSNVAVSSTKQITGHCLGAASIIENALLCKLLDDFDGRLYPHVYDGIYNPDLPKINLVGKNEKHNKCKICMNNSFGFGGANAILILRKT